MGAAISARRCFYSNFHALKGNPGVCGTGEPGTRAWCGPCITLAPIPPQGTLTMLAVLPQDLSVWMAKEDETFSMERPFTITM